MKRIELKSNKNITIYDIIEGRGSRPKYWFSFNDSENKEKWLFKSTNRDTTNSVKTFEDYGEIIFNKICKQLDIPCAEYKLAFNYEKGYGNEGVISKNYNPNGLVEISAYSLLDFYKNFMYDNFNGIVVDNENTLSNYIKGLQTLKFDNPNLHIDENKILLQLEKMFILDYICCQSDRNWYNVAFLIDPKKSELTLCPLFDNGNIFCWNYKESVIKHQRDSLKNKNNIAQLNELLSSKSIALGIVTPTALRDLNNPLRTQKSKQSPELMSKVNEELIKMICSSSELKDFVFENFYKDNGILRNAFKEAEEEYGEFPELLKEQSSLIYNLKCNNLLELVKEKLIKDSEQEAD